MDKDLQALIGATAEALPGVTSISWAEEDPDYLAYLEAQDARGSLAGAPEAMGCYECGGYDGKTAPERKVVKLGPVAEAHRDPTQTYILNVATRRSNSTPSPPTAGWSGVTVYSGTMGPMARDFDEGKVRRWPSGERGGQFREKAQGSWVDRISGQIGHKLNLTIGGARLGGDTWIERVTQGMDRPHMQAHLVHSKILEGKKTKAPPPPIDVLMKHFSDQPSANLENLQLVGAGNENLYRKHMREIPRSQMPQLPETVEGMKDFMDGLAAMGVKAELIEIDPRELVATQNELDTKKVGQIFNAIMGTGWLEDSVMIASRELAVLDGHHRWGAGAAAVAAGKQFKLKALHVDMPIDELLAFSDRYSGARKAMEQQFTG